MWEEKFTIGIFTWPRAILFVVFSCLNTFVLHGKHGHHTLLGWALIVFSGFVIVIVCFYVGLTAGLSFVRKYHKDIRDPLGTYPTDGFREIDYIIAHEPKRIVGSLVEIHAEIIGLLICLILEIGFIGFRILL